jgi:hypothetical protein
MSIPEIRKGIANARREILSSLQSEGAAAGADMAALVENRIVTKGERREGGKLSPYSNKEVPAFFYFGRSRNSGGEAQVRKASKERRGVSYRQFREYNGLNTGVKNLQFTGEMWQGFGLRSVRVIGEGVVEIEIGGKNERSNLLLDAHSRREGTEVTAPSEAEIQAIGRAVSERINSIIERNLKG